MRNSNLIIVGLGVLPTSVFLFVRVCNIFFMRKIDSSNFYVKIVFLLRKKKHKKTPRILCLFFLGEDATTKEQASDRTRTTTLRTTAEISRAQDRHLNPFNFFCVFQFYKIIFIFYM